MKRLCYKCFNYNQPVRLLSKNAKIYYLGCSRCGSGCFFNEGKK